MDLVCGGVKNLAPASREAGVVVGLILSLAGVYMVGGGRAGCSPGLRSGHVQKHQNSLQL